MNIGKNLLPGCLVLSLTLFLSACGAGSAKPIDGKTRELIDSLAGVEQRKAKAEIDSLCAAERTREMPHLIDSIKQVRLSEINEQLKSIPK